MKEIITFRPTPEVQEILSRAKEEGSNVSKYINTLILTAASGDKAQYCTAFSFYPEWTEEEPMPEAYIRLLNVCSTSVGSLPTRRYKEFMDVLRENGMDRYYFRLDADNVFCIISSSHEEAAVEFAKYFIRDPKTKEYSRTTLPLPQIRYDVQNRKVIVVRKEPQW